MPGARGRRRERPSREEVQNHWQALSWELRQACLRFEDPALVERVEVSLATLYERQTMMQALGLAHADDEDPLEASTLMKEVFELSCAVRYAKQRAPDEDDEDVVLVDREVSAVLTVKADAARRDDLLERMSSVLPDFLSQKCSRQVMPRARWKDVLTTEPASVGELERQLARLVEQALWSIVLDPALKVEQTQKPIGPSSGELELEPWMEEHDARVKKKADRRKARKTKVPVPPALAPSTAAHEPTDSQEEERVGLEKAQMDPDTSSTEEVAEAARSSSEEEAWEPGLISDDLEGCENAALPDVGVEPALEQLHETSREQPKELTAHELGYDDEQILDEPVASGDLGVGELQTHAAAREEPASDEGDSEAGGPSIPLAHLVAAPTQIMPSVVAASGACPAERRKGRSSVTPTAVEAQPVCGSNYVFVRPPPGLEDVHCTPDMSDVVERAPCYVSKSCLGDAEMHEGRRSATMDIFSEELKHAVALQLAGSDLFGKLQGA